MYDRVASGISIHAPVRGATYHYRTGGGYGSISIHAPVRGATIITNPLLRGIMISIHAPVRGATSIQQLDALRKEFQSTRPCGARPTVANNALDTANISIHAPVRGATCSDCRISKDMPNFNPRARAGRDIESAVNWWSVRHFNPRARAGRDSCRGHYED